MKAVKVMMALAIGLALMITAGCATEPKYSGFLGDYDKYVQPGPEGGAKYDGLNRESTSPGTTSS